MTLNDSKNWRIGRKCIFKNNVHLIFLTKHKYNVFDLQIIERLKEIFTETCQQLGCHLINFQGDSHYVHLIVSVPPKIAISNLVGKLKGKSSYLISREFPMKEKTKGKQLWSPSYCVLSHGDNPLQDIKRFFSLDQED